ncbi:MAG: 4-hydroxy-tetrahydrodipicolinate reductase [Bacteroidales bacterium]|nr:4-hydroxy-tetrahydrodipicolinate reductase [Bacteroidales bacterium]
MRIAIIGYGKIGQLVEQIAIKRNHEICLVVDKHNIDDLKSIKNFSPDVAVEFTGPDSAFNNYLACFSSGIPVVSGSTGWLTKYDEAVDFCNKSNSGFFYASNFSLGVNLFFELNKQLATLMHSYNDYIISLEETHHIHKLDAPSGTAVSLLNDILKINDSYSGYSLEKIYSNNIIPVESKRIGEVPGIHKVKYESETDFIEITHSAKSRHGFAIGAVLAAEFICGKKGIFSMKDLIKLK